MRDNTGLYAIAQTVRTRAKELSDDILFSFEDQEITYAEYDSASNKAANGLLDAGIKKGDRIAFLGKNSPVYFELIAAASKIQAVMTPLNWRLAGPELEYILNDCGAKLVFATAEFRSVLAEIEPSLHDKPAVYVVAGDERDEEAYLSWRERFSDIDPMLDDSADDDVLQLYTSGTTGRPKGAVLSSRNVLAIRGQEHENKLHDWQLYDRGESGLLVMPCFHVGGTSFGLGIIHSGAHIVVIPEYDPNEVLDLIEKYSVGKVFMVPASLQMLLAHPRIDKADFSSLKYIFYGASPIPFALMREAIDRIGCGFVQMYGATETGGTVVALSPEDHLPETTDAVKSKRMRSVGKPLWGVELKVIDDDGASVPSETIGEIAVRSVKNIRRYWNLPEETKKTIDTDGWLRTGDAGYLDDDGYLYIHDRVKDMVISGGENIYPAEVEDAIFSHENIADVAVIGIPDDKWGEAIMAFVVAKGGAELSEVEVIEFAKSRIARFKCPKSVKFVAALPRNASGKILRRELREPYWKGKERAVN